MSMTDPLVITVNAVDKSMNRINQDQYSSEYLLRSTTDEYRGKIRHSTVLNKPTGLVYDRHNFEVVRTVFAAGDVPQYYDKFYVVAERLPSNPDTYMPNAVADLLIASSDAFMVKLFSWQS